MDKEYELIEVDVDEETYALLEQAAALTGQTVDEFASEAIENYIKKLIEEEDIIENE